MQPLPLPTRIGHTPLIALPYAAHDGPFAGHTDTHYLTFGLAQWGSHYKQEYSLKILRHSGQRWSRLSEELPPHRAIDLVIFLAAVLASNGRSSVAFPANTFEQQPQPLVVPWRGTPDIPEPDRELLLNRMEALLRMLVHSFPEMAAKVQGS